MEDLTDGHVHDDDGLVALDPTSLSVAHLPYEIQVMIFEAASGLQILFVVLNNDKSMGISPAPIQSGLAATCRMARRVYLQDKVRALDRYWVDAARDIFYLRDDAMPIRFRVRVCRMPRPSPSDVWYFVCCCGVLPAWIILVAAPSSSYPSEANHRQYRFLEMSLRKYNRDMMLNVAIDLECLGEHPRRDAV